MTLVTAWPATTLLVVATTAADLGIYVARLLG